MCILVEEIGGLENQQQKSQRIARRQLSDQSNPLEFL